MVGIKFIKIIGSCRQIFENSPKGFGKTNVN